jgi:hypothetical protein
MTAPASRPQALRKRLFVEPRIQGALLVRATMYWVCALLAITLMLLLWRIFTGPARVFYLHFDDMWFFYGPALVASFVLLPLVLVDVVKLSNRFVGPLVRFRRALAALARGEHVAPLHFRQGDYWQEIAADFNLLVERLANERSPQPCEEEAVASGAP